MSGGSISRRYARAVFALAEEEGNLDRTGREVSQLAEAIKASDELQQALTNPAFAKSDREKILSALFAKLGVSTTVKHFGLLLLERDRVSVLPGIARELQALIDAKVGRVHAVVTSATKLDPAQQQKLQATLISAFLSLFRVSCTTAYCPPILKR